MPEKTLFEKIIAREIPGNILHEDDLCIVLEDINPQAPTHLLVIPKEPIARVESAKPEHQVLLGHLMLIAAAQAKEQGLAHGYRVVINNGLDACESVPHLHIHVIGGRKMSWPPG